MSLLGDTHMSEATRNNFAPEGSGSNGLSRRQIVKAGVWAAPVVVLATAAPAAASSTDFSITLVSLTSSGRDPWTNITVNVRNNNTAVDANVTVALTASNGVTRAAPTSRSFLVPKGTTIAFTGFGQVSIGNNGNNGYTISATATAVPVNWSAGNPLSGPIRGGNLLSL